MKPSLYLFYGVVSVSLCLFFRVNAEVNKTEAISADVYFHEGDLGRKGHCNNGWIVFKDYVLVIDGNFPSGALEVIPKIKALTNKPIRFAFNTHHHGDHAYGNQVWLENGAVAVAHEGALQEMRKYETGLFGDKPGRWEEAAMTRPDVAASKLQPPSLLFRKELFFDDGVHRVELMHFGVAHTRGDGWAWLPKERILFSGDACVNGPYNFVGDGSVKDWIETLEAVKKLNPRLVCPGHGPAGGPEVLEEQQRFFITLSKEVAKLVTARRTSGDVKSAIPGIKATIRKDETIARYIGGMFESQVEKIYVEMGGKPFDKAAAAAEKHWKEAQAASEALAQSRSKRLNLPSASGQ